MSEIVRDIIREVLAPGVFDNIRDVANRNAARDIRRLALAAGAGAVVIHVGEAVGGLVLHVGKEAAEAVAAHGTGEFGEFCNKTAETLVEHGLDAGEEVAEEAHAERKAAARAGDIVVTGPGTRAADVVFDLSDHAMAAIADEIQDVDRHHIGEDTVHGVAAMAKTGAFAMAASGLVGVAFSAPVSLSVGGAVLLGALAKGFLKQRAERLEAKATGRSHVSEASFAVANQLGIQKTGVLASLTRFVRSVVDLKVQPAVSSTGIIHPTNGQEPGASDLPHL